MTSATVAIERLRQIAPVVAIVGVRIYQLRLPEKSAFPAIRVQLIDEDQPYHLRGGQVLLRGRVQIDAFGADAGTGWLGALEALAAAIHGDSKGPQATGISGWKGQVGGSPATAEVTGVFRVDVGQGYDAGALRLARIRQDYMVQWRSLM